MTNKSSAVLNSLIVKMSVFMLFSMHIKASYPKMGRTWYFQILSFWEEKEKVGKIYTAMFLTFLKLMQNMFYTYL